MKSPSQHAHAGCPLFESPAGVCSLSPHPLPFAIPCESSKHFYAFPLPLSGPERCAWVEAAALFPCSFLTSASCSLLPVIMRSSRSAGISSPGSPAGPAALRARLGSAPRAGELITAALQSRLREQTAATSRAPASRSRRLAEGDPPAGGNWPSGGKREVVWGVFLWRGIAAGWSWQGKVERVHLLRVAPEPSEPAGWVALGWGVGEGHRWSLAFKQGSVRFQVCCERQPRQQRSLVGQVYAARTRTAKNTLWGFAG